MLDKVTIVWGIHAGKKSDVDSLFLGKNYIAIGWPEVGDLRKLRANRDAFKARVTECYPDAHPGAILSWVGQMFRFAHEIKRGDFVIYPSRQTRQIHVGRIKGQYRFDPRLEESYPSLLPVRWLGSFPRSRFCQSALYEIGAARSLFRVKRHAHEFLAAIERTVEGVRVAHGHAKKR